MLSLWIVTPLGGPVQGQPKCRYLNLDLYPGSKLVGGDFKACVLLENPQGKNFLNYDNLICEVRNTPSLSPDKKF